MNFYINYGSHKTSQTAVLHKAYISETFNLHDGMMAC